MLNLEERGARVLTVMAPQLLLLLCDQKTRVFCVHFSVIVSLLRCTYFAKRHCQDLPWALAPKCTVRFSDRNYQSTLPQLRFALFFFFCPSFSLPIFGTSGVLTCLLHKTPRLGAPGPKWVV